MTSQIHWDHISFNNTAACFNHAPSFALSTDIYGTSLQPVGTQYYCALALSLAMSTIESGTNRDHTEPNIRNSSRRKEPKKANKKKKITVMKLSEKELSICWYSVLDVEDTATPEQIRIAYKKKCLETHPDKQPNASDEEFKKVQRAFELLMDDESRSAIDGARVFDDTIPPEVVPEDAFYRVFGPVFNRNKKWSTSSTILTLGDDTTAMEQVEKFYSQWYQFKTNRNFSSSCDIIDINEAGDRYGKRYIQRENQSKLDNARKKELERIRRLVDRAYANDPRIARHHRKIKIMEAMEKLLKSENEVRTEKEREEEWEINTLIKQSKCEIERIKKQEVKVNRKYFKDEITKILDELNLIDRISKTQKLLNEQISISNLSWIYSCYTVNQMESLLTDVTNITKVSNPCKDIISIINRAILDQERDAGMTRYGEAIKTIKSSESIEKAKVVVQYKWSDEDIRLLVKAITQFPGGTVDRWRRIKQYTFKNNSMDITEEEILAKTKEIEDSWKKGVKFVKAETKINSVPLTCGTKDTQTFLYEARIQRIISKYAPDKVENIPIMLEKAKGREEEFIEKLVKKFGPEPIETIPANNVCDDEWTSKQQEQLEQGLRALKNYKEKDKFIKIAEYVDKKSSKQCLMRYKYLCSLHKS